ncbi:arylsulfotransferase family protein [soil metagenome]
MTKVNWPLLQKIFLAWAIVVLAFAYGYFSRNYHLFPDTQLRHALTAAKPLKAKLDGRPPPNYTRTKADQLVTIDKSALMAPGMTLVVTYGLDGTGTTPKLIDAEGRVIHTWNVDWFRVWPQPGHLSAGKQPKSLRDTEIHGLALSANGDLTYNYSDLGMVQLDVCSRVKWRLPYEAHHVVFAAEDGTFWSLDLIRHAKADPSLPNHQPPFREEAVLHISAGGKLLERIPIIKMLQANHLQGLLYLGTTDNESTKIVGEGLHSNDVEVFPSTMKPGAFAAGDVLVSLRNINAAIVFDPKTKVIKHLITGGFVRQHDIDFVDGWTVRVFDNNNVGQPEGKQSSRIVQVSLKGEPPKVLFEGNRAHPFYTDVMGKQELLANGDLLVVEAHRGRALEVSSAGEVVWEYNNLVSKGLLGSMTEAQRISPQVLSVERLRQLVAACPKVGS